MPWRTIGSFFSFFFYLGPPAGRRVSVLVVSFCLVWSPCSALICLVISPVCVYPGVVAGGFACFVWPSRCGFAGRRNGLVQFTIIINLVLSPAFSTVLRVPPLRVPPVRLPVGREVAMPPPPPAAHDDTTLHYCNKGGRHKGGYGSFRRSAQVLAPLHTRTHTENGREVLHLHLHKEWGVWNRETAFGMFRVRFEHRPQGREIRATDRTRITPSRPPFHGTHSCYAPFAAKSLKPLTGALGRGGGGFVASSTNCTNCSASCQLCM